MRGGGEGLATEQRRLISHMLELVPLLVRNAQIGKEEKFRTFVLVSLRDKVRLCSDLSMASFMGHLCWLYFCQL